VVAVQMRHERGQRRAFGRWFDHRGQPDARCGVSEHPVERGRIAERVDHDPFAVRLELDSGPSKPPAAHCVLSFVGAIAIANDRMPISCRPSSSLARSEPSQQ
jgi:hypothetical protein